MHQRTADGRISVGVVLHSLSYDIGNLGVGSIVNLVHCVEHSALNRFETVHDMRHGTVENGVGSIIQIPFLEHSGEFEVAAVVAQQFLETSRFRGFSFRYFLFLKFFRIAVFNFFESVFCHKIVFAHCTQVSV